MESGAIVTILPCNDLDASERFYARLGFVREERPEPGEPDAYRILSNGSGHLHLTDAVEGWLNPGKNPFGLYVYREDVDAVARWFGARPAHMPWGMYEFSVSDPDETLVRVGWPSKSVARTAQAISAVERNDKTRMSRPKIDSISPFFIVSDVETIIAFYRDKLGFELQYKEPDENPFFAIVARDGAWLHLKAGDAGPLPNPRRDPAMRWDAFCETCDPDALAAEYTARGVPFSKPLEDTEEGLRGFEITDPDGYVLFFGCPVASAT